MRILEVYWATSRKPARTVIYAQIEANELPVGWVTCKVRRGTRREGGLGRYPRGYQFNNRDIQKMRVLKRCVMNNAPYGLHVSVHGLR